MQQSDQESDPGGEKGSGELRAVFLEYQPRKDTSSQFRPFHHVRVVVTDVGQHQNGELLSAQSTGLVYDRHDGVVIGTMQKDKTMQPAIPEEYNGLTEGWKSVYYGYTDLSLDEIESIARDKLVQTQIDSGTDYNIVFNNCHTFAEDLAFRINQTSVKSYPTTAGGFPINAVATHRPWEAAQILRPFNIENGIEYDTIAEAEARAAGSEDDIYASNDSSVEDYSDAGSPRELSPTLEASDLEDESDQSEQPGSPVGASDDFLEAYRNELQPW